MLLDVESLVELEMMLYCTSTTLLFVAWRRLRGRRAHAPRRFALPGGARGSLLWLVLPSAVVCGVFASNVRSHALSYAALLLLGGVGHGVARCREMSKQRQRSSTVRRLARCLGSL